MPQTECRCPMCKKIHLVDTIPLSPTRPWIYCSKCGPKVSARSGGVKQALSAGSGRSSPKIGAE